MSKLPADIQVRREALRPDASYAVAAPAGSGKTALLTQRALTLLAHCEYPEEVLCITFTRKAAGEMQNRICEALVWAARDPQPEEDYLLTTWQLARKVLEQDKAQGWQLLRNPSRLRIQTIDSLCRAIVSQLPLESGLGSPPENLEQPELAYQMAVRALFAELETGEDYSDDLALLLRHLDNNLSSAEDLLVSLLSRREQWLEPLLQLRHGENARSLLEHALQQVIEEQLSQVRHSLEYYAAQLCPMLRRAADNLRLDNPAHPLVQWLDLAELPDHASNNLSLWQALADLLLTDKGTLRKAVNKNQGFPKDKEHKDLKETFALLREQLEAQGPELIGQLRACQCLPAPNYDEQQWQLLDALTRLLPVLAAQLNLVFGNLGGTDYTQVSLAALSALGEDEQPSDIALKLDYRIRHILVDEFQDTANLQLRLLEKLTAGWQPGDGRTLFIVGDGMQSCYGFRNANVGIFLEARRHGIGQVPVKLLDLSVNFRSQQALVDWVNHTFAGAFPAVDDIGRGAVRYAPSQAYNDPLPGPAVEIFGCLSEAEDEDSESDHWQSAEGAQVAQLARRALAENSSGSVAILVRSRPQLKQILPQLSAAGLSWQATDIDTLSSRMAVIDLLSLTRALLDPADRIAWLSILRAPWCGLDLHDLYRLARRHSEQPKQAPPVRQNLQQWQQITDLSPDAQSILSRVVPVLEKALEQRRRKPLRQWVEGVWLALGGPAGLGDSADLENAETFFNLLEQHQRGGRIHDWPAFDRAVQDLYAQPQADGDPRLQVMTIHKAKGLEFDTVILPGLSRGSRSDGNPLLLWRERLSLQGEKQLLVSSLAPTGDSQDPIYRHMQVENKLQAEYEATRLLYVACTRASRRLYLLASLKTGDDDQPKAPPGDSLLARIWDTAAKQLTLVTAASDQSRATPGLQHLLRLPPQWQAPPVPHCELLKPYRGREFGGADNLPTADALRQRLQRYTGTAIHRALEQLCRSGLAHWDEAQLRQRAPLWRSHLLQLGVAPHDLDAALAQVQRAVQLTLADPDGRWLLDNKHHQSACELALWHWRGAELITQVIDRTFVASGRRWVVDYKSAEPGAGETVTDFLARESAQYRAQLTNYATALEQLGEESVSAALYFPLLESDSRLQVLDF